MKQKFSAPNNGGSKVVALQHHGSKVSNCDTASSPPMHKLKRGGSKPGSASKIKRKPSSPIHAGESEDWAGMGSKKLKILGYINFNEKHPKECL